MIPSVRSVQPSGPARRRAADRRAASLCSAHRRAVLHRRPGAAHGAGRGPRAPCAAVRVRQARDRRLRPRAGRARRRDRLDGRDRAGARAPPGSRSARIEDFTGFPEIMDGRVKTLHPKLYAGLLAVRDDPEHLRAGRRARHRVRRPRLREPLPVRAHRRPLRRERRAEVIENIDIGGPTMIRAAAKNHAFAVVVVRPESYDAVLEELRESRRDAVAADARVRSPPRRSPTPRATTPRSRAGSPRSSRSSRRCTSAPSRRSRTCPTARTRTSARAYYAAGRRARPRALAGPPAPRQADLVQQHPRPRRGARPRCATSRRARVRDRQAQQPVRRRTRREPARAPTAPRSRATR